MNSLHKRRDLCIATLNVVFALAVLFVWIPRDIDTGVIDEWRRTVRIGDAMMPTFAAIGMLISGFVIAVRTLWRDERNECRQMEFGFVLAMALILFLSLLLMMKTGPVLVNILLGEGASYSSLRASAPWKYLGFFVGGTSLVFCCISLSYRAVRWRYALIAFLSTLLIAALYDLPFDNLILPPNGDF